MRRGGKRKIEEAKTGREGEQKEEMEIGAEGTRETERGGKMDGRWGGRRLERRGRGKGR